MAASNESASTFAAIDASGNEDRYPYDNRWSLQQTTGPERLVVAPDRRRHVDVLLDLSRCLREPFAHPLRPSPVPDRRAPYRAISEPASDEPWIPRPSRND